MAAPAAPKGCGRPCSAPAPARSLPPAACAGVVIGTRFICQITSLGNTSNTLDVTREVKIALNIADGPVVGVGIVLDAATAHGLPQVLRSAGAAVGAASAAGAPGDADHTVITAGAA